MSILDISNWTIDEINNSIDTFKDTSLTDIGMVNCDIDSINIVGGVTTATLWIDEDIGIDGYTGTAPLKVYKEDKVEIKLNSPLLEGDTIEVKDGKLCHVHRYEKVVLDGSENWISEYTNTAKTVRAFFTKVVKDIYVAGQWSTHWTSDKFLSGIWYDVYSTNAYSHDKEIITGSVDSAKRLYVRIKLNRLVSDTTDGFEQWLQENPTTVVYELAEPYYEDITPYQSSIILKTFLESSMIINTNLPIKTNVSYRTNVPSISTLSNRVAEVSESDNVIHNLINIIDDEVDE